MSRTAPATGWNNGVTIGSGDTLLVDGTKNAYLLHLFILKMIILPRQARDKHRETSKQRDGFFTGAKRDRTIWPGDMGVSVATALATTGEANSSINSLETLYALQAPSGMLPYVGPQVYCQKAWPEAKDEECVEGSHNSDMYHLWVINQENGGFLHHFILKMFILPRQARDNHRINS